MLFGDELEPEEYLVVCTVKVVPITYKQYVSKRSKELAQSHKHISAQERMRILAKEWKEIKQGGKL